MSFAPLPDFYEGCAELLALGFALHRLASDPRLRPVVGEAEEVEGLRFSFTVPRVAEVHDPGFLRVEREPVVFENAFPPAPTAPRLLRVRSQTSTKSSAKRATAAKRSSSPIASSPIWS